MGYKIENLPKFQSGAPTTELRLTRDTQSVMLSAKLTFPSTRNQAGGSMKLVAPHYEDTVKCRLDAG